MDTKDTGAPSMSPLKKNKVKIIIVVLAVIFLAIIAVHKLSSMAATSLASAKLKSEDALIKANLSSLLPTALQYSMDKMETSKNISETDDFSGLCDDKNFQQSINAIPKVNGHNPVCNNNKTAFAVSTLLHSGKYFCIDNTGNRPYENEINGDLSPGTTVCPEQ